MGEVFDPIFRSVPLQQMDFKGDRILEEIYRHRRMLHVLLGSDRELPTTGRFDAEVTSCDEQQLGRDTWLACLMGKRRIHKRLMIRSMLDYRLE